MVKIKNLGLTKTKFAKQKYRQFKRRYKLNNTIRNRSIRIDDEKGYKKVMGEMYKIYCKQMSDDLKNASEPVKILPRSSNNESIIA
jgi:hypothetical protein